MISHGTVWKPPPNYHNQPDLSLSMPDKTNESKRYMIGCWGVGVTFPIDPNICNNHSRVTEGGPTTKPSVAKLAFTNFFID